jgi:LuxR family maltose regulon positive regulatory protein
MQAGDYTRASSLVAADIDACWSSKGMTAQSESWVEQLPEDAIHQNLTLMLARVSIHLRQLQIEPANLWLDVLERRLADAPLSAETQIFEARIAMLRSYIMRMQQVDSARVQAMSELALEKMPERDYVWRIHALLTHAAFVNASLLDPRRAYEYVSEGAELALRNNNHEAHVHCLSMGAMCLCYMGALRRSGAMLGRIDRLLKAWNMPATSSRTWRENIMMRLAYERNDMQTVEDIARPLLERAIAGTDHIAIVNATVNLVHMCQARGDFDEAIRIIGSAEMVCLSSPLSKMHIGALRAFVMSEHGDATLLEEWVDETSSRLGSRLIWRIPGVHEDLRMYLARAHFRLGDPVSAISLLNGYIKQLEETQARDMWIRCLLLRALAHEKEGARAEALDDLRVALSLSKPEGYLRVFLDEGPALFNLLLAARARNIEPVYVMKLLEAFNPKQAFSSAPAIADAQAMNEAEAMHWVEAISSREKQVLDLLTAGHTNQSIADTLGITLTTVKSHAGAIYTKLGVKSRTQAIARARELGLLS